jgi:AcrR family transcriptional regulator
VGVGPGTLYRHFPSREALIEAVYRTEVEKLAAAQRSFAETMPHIEALRAWKLLFVDYIAAKKIIAPALNTLIGDPKKVFEASYTLVWEAIHTLVKRAVKSGDIHKDLDPIDVSSNPDWQQSARRLVDILITGARHRSNRLGGTPLTPSTSGWRAKCARPCFIVVGTREHADYLGHSWTFSHRGWGPATRGAR